MAKPMSRKDRFREWVSDNLRYMLLILAIVAVVGLGILIVHLVTSGSDDGEAEPKAEVTATPTPAAESEPAAESQSGQAAAEFAAENNAQVSTVATTYYQALAAKDMDTVKSCVDALAAEDEAQILEEDMVEAYNDITTYTLNGTEEGTYIAFVSYNCKYKGIDTQLPMLTELYMYTNTEGNLVIAADVETDTAIAEAMSSALEQEDASAARDMPSQEALKPFKDRQSGLWGLRRGPVLTAPPRYAAISATRGDFAAVKFGDGHMAVVDDSGHVRMELGRHRRARFLPDDLMALTDDSQPDTYIDLRNGQPYAQRPAIVRFGPIELLRSDGVYYSRTREVFRSPPGTAPYDFVRRSFYLLAYDYSSPPSVPTVDPPDALPGRSCACLLEGDAERYYWFCGKLADGSIVVADNDGNYYHAEKGKEKRRIACQRPLPGEEGFHAAVHRLKAYAARRARKHQYERRAEEEKRRQERLAALRQAVPFHAGPKWGLKMGDTIVVPPIYRNIQTPVGYFCAVECNPRQWGVIMLDGKVVIEARYTNVKINNNGTAQLTIFPGMTRTVDLSHDAERLK